jgi:hypothetical protein
MEELIAELEALTLRFEQGAYPGLQGSKVVAKARMALRAQEIDPTASFEMDVLADMLIGRNRASDVELLQRTVRILKEPPPTLPAKYQRCLQ